MEPIIILYTLWFLCEAYAVNVFIIVKALGSFIWSVYFCFFIIKYVAFCHNIVVAHCNVLVEQEAWIGHISFFLIVAVDFLCSLQIPSIFAMGFHAHFFFQVLAYVNHIDKNISQFICCLFYCIPL